MNILNTLVQMSYFSNICLDFFVVENMRYMFCTCTAYSLSLSLDSVCLYCPAMHHSGTD